MRFAILGFQTSGKTTIFNALTGQQAQTEAFATGRQESHQAVVKVPDERLDQLSELFTPKKHTPATVEYLDIAGIARGDEATGEGLGDRQLTDIGPSEALLAVVRGFTNAAGDTPSPEDDIEAMAMEMVLSDLRKVENRLERIDKQIARAQGADKRRLEDELAGLKLVRPALEEGRPARAVALEPAQEKALRGFQLLSLKPVMILVNEDEATWKANQDAPIPLGSLEEVPGTAAARLCGQMEMEIAHLPEEDRKEFLDELGIEEPAARRVIRLCYDLLGCISFFTVGQDECRAWTIRRGAPAPAAAGEIHSDLERGFIRAEVVPWEVILKLGSHAEARRQGSLRVEGKDYVVQDGDVMNILFNV